MEGVALAVEVKQVGWQFFRLYIYQRIVVDVEGQQAGQSGDGVQRGQAVAGQNEDAQGGEVF